MDRGAVCILHECISFFFKHNYVMSCIIYASRRHPNKPTLFGVIFMLHNNNVRIMCDGSSSFAYKILLEYNVVYD